MNDPTRLSIYQLRAVLNGVSPLVWRRFLLSIETSLADLHKTLQLSSGWSGFYLYEFCIHGKSFGSNAEDPRSVCLGDFGLPVAMERKATLRKSAALRQRRWDGPQEPLLELQVADNQHIII